MIRDYMVNEGNQIGYMPTEFDENGNLVETKLVADGDLPKGAVVEVSGDMKVKVTSGASAKVIGVSMFDTRTGRPARVECEGLFKLTASVAITAGDLVCSAADGKVGKVSAEEHPIGIALNDASGDGKPVYVKFSI